MNAALHVSFEFQNIVLILLVKSVFSEVFVQNSFRAKECHGADFI